MTPPRKRSTDSPPLDRDRVFAEAVALADEVGVAKLSMRKLAGRLGVEAMSLYHHVPNKSAILDGMVDVVFGEMHVPATLPWRACMAERARSQREVLLRHPWAVGLIESRTSPGMATLAHHDTTIGRLRSAGMSAELVGHAVAMLDAYVFGFVIQEISLPFDTGDEAAELAESVLAQAAAFAPNMAWFAQQVVMQPDYAFSNEFEVGLELILDGLAARHDT